MAHKVRATAADRAVPSVPTRSRGCWLSKGSQDEAQGQREGEGCHTHRHCGLCLRHFGASDSTSSMNTLSTNAAAASFISIPDPLGCRAVLYGEHQSQPRTERLQDRNGVGDARAFQVPPKQRP